MGKRIRDPIHRFLYVEDHELRLVDHRLLQRLRWVSQLPLEQLVYPSAQHSRFEHSLGVMHLAGKAAKALIGNSANTFEQACEQDENFRKLEQEDCKNLFINCAKACGLLHDIGHAPFSHTLEDACKHLPDIPYRYHHEEVGYHLAKQVLEDAHYPELEAAVINQVLTRLRQL